MRIFFTRYAAVADRGLSWEELLALAAEQHDIHARAEDSGSEGVYVEVARWNPKANRWERFAYEKCFGGEDVNARDANGEVVMLFGEATVDAWATAERIAACINERSGNRNVNFVHDMPTWQSDDGVPALLEATSNLFTAVSNLIEKSQAVEQELVNRGIANDLGHLPANLFNAASDAQKAMFAVKRLDFIRKAVAGVSREIAQREKARGQ